MTRVGMCNSLTGRHKYEPRFDEVPTGIDLLKLPYHLNVKEARSLLFRRVYVQDVCRYCGDVVERLTDPPEMPAPPESHPDLDITE